MAQPLRLVMRQAVSELRRLRRIFRGIRYLVARLRTLQPFRDYLLDAIEERFGEALPIGEALPLP
eukprot:10621200-Lingulodinium_polyedra.AAC.1